MTGSLHTHPRSDIEIARARTLRPIGEIAAGIGIDEDNLIPYGRWKAKVELEFVRSLADRPTTVPAVAYVWAPETRDRVPRDLLASTRHPAPHGSREHAQVCAHAES